MTSADPDFITWRIETNAYHGVLEDKNTNIIKLETPEGENFHEFITLKLEMDPSKVDKVFESEVVEAQIEMRIKFKPDCENLRAARIVKWLPNTKIVAEKELSCLDRIEKSILGGKRGNNFPKFHFIVAIDETAQFSKGPNGSIQPKLRKAVNNLVLNLYKRMKAKNEHNSFGLVVVRFGGTMHTESSTFNTDEGPFKRQKIRDDTDHAGKSIYEFAPFPDAKVNRLSCLFYSCSDPEDQKNRNTSKVEETVPLLNENQKNEDDKNVVAFLRVRINLF